LRWPLMDNNYLLMSLLHTLENLYEEYTDFRKLRISLNQFTHIVHFYPVLLIISTDGKVDEKEWKYVQHLSDSLGDLYLQDITDPELLSDLKALYLNEFKFLLMNFKDPAAVPGRKSGEKRRNPADHVPVCQCIGWGTRERGDYD
jgi:hypothetical protein